MKLRIIPTSEGYFDVITKQYIYNYTDHLGNVRLSYSDTNKDGIIQPRQYQSLICNISPAGNICYQGWKPGEIVEVNNYYPFGLMHNYTATTQNAYQYKYNGKELQESGMYDYGARFYMPDIGRWGVVDPLAESSRRFTPYHYGNNNPIRFIDPDGRLTMDNLSSYSHGSAVADFVNRNGFGDDYLPMFYRDEGGMMIVNEALGNDGQGGGGNPKPSAWQQVKNFFRNLFGGKKKEAEITEFGPLEKISMEEEKPDMTVAIVMNLLFGNTDPFMNLGNSGIGAYAEERETVGMVVMPLVNPEAGLEKVVQNLSIKGGTKLLTQGRFPNFAKKFGKHSGEWSQWGAISENAFYNRALKLADSPVSGSVKGFTSKQGYNFRYNTKTGEFLTTQPDGIIQTFFRPKQGFDYYLKQVQLYGN